MKLLTQDQVQKQLSKLDVEWAVIDGVHLERVYNFEDFDKALTFVNKVGKIVQEQNHHPEIELSWGKVVVRTTTHEASGLTKKDFDLAKTI